jgi:hypothetical protein
MDEKKRGSLLEFSINLCDFFHLNPVNSHKFVWYSHKMVWNTQNFCVGYTLGVIST